MNRFMTLFKIVVILLLSLFLGCGGDGSEKQTVAVSSVSLTADKNQAVADGNDHITFTATVENSTGAPIAQQKIDFNIPQSTSPYAMHYGYIGYTDDNGKATIAINSQPLGPNSNQVMNVSASSGGIASNVVTVTFDNPPQLIPATVTLTADKASFKADGIDNVVFLVTATDAGGLPLAGQAFDIDISAGGPPMAGTGDAFTDASGQARISLKCASSQVGMVSPIVLSVSATINGVISNVMNISLTPPEMRKGLTTKWLTNGWGYVRVASRTASCRRTEKTILRHEMTL